MVDQVQAPTQSNPAPQGPPSPSTSALATRTIDENRTTGGGVDASGLRRDLDRIRAQDPEFGGWVAAEVNRQLTPVQRGELAAAGYSIQAPDGASLRFQPNAPSVGDYRAMAPGSEGRAFYNRLDSAFGDGDPATDDTPAIQAGLNDLVASGGSLDQLPANTPAPANDEGPSTATMVADLTQLGLDLVGIVEPTPFADGANTVISLGRALFEWDASHLVGAAASGASMIPYLGDTAKFAKIPQWARTVSNAVEAIVRNPALRDALEPALRQVYDGVRNVPQGVIDLMPQGAREAFDRMKSQLDEFFGAGARAADDVPSYTATLRGEQVVLRGVEGVPVTYTKRARAEYLDLRRAFDNGVRADFARHLVSNPDNIAALRRAGIDDAGIARLQNGQLPQGWQVHHKLPLDDGGTNDFGNLVLIKNDPYHLALTNEQRRLVGDLAVGQSRQVTFPVPQGFVYPPAP